MCKPFKFEIFLYNQSQWSVLLSQVQSKDSIFLIIFWGTSDLPKKAIPLSVYTSELCLAINYKKKKKKTQTDYISFLPHLYKKKNPSR